MPPERVVIDQRQDLAFALIDASNQLISLVGMGDGEELEDGSSTASLDTWNVNKSLHFVFFLFDGNEDDFSRSAL